ncbi:unnamed protein product [Rotaria sp. Silwood1]|nr:unnamed protein product [Rotaria sp. Silwood1]CAF1375223.1 unnamed protein product [Rotaria sp. Silwood1]
MLFYTIRDPPARYSRESNGSSSAEPLNKSNDKKLSVDRSSEIVIEQSVRSESEQTINDRLHELSLKYEIDTTLSERLHILKDYEIIILCDDSGSMKTTVDGTDRTRWGELHSIVKIVLKIGTVFDASFVDIYFLNRQPIYNVTDPQAIDQQFSIPFHSMVIHHWYVL